MTGLSRDHFALVLPAEGDVDELLGWLELTPGKDEVGGVIGSREFVQAVKDHAPVAEGREVAAFPIEPVQEEGTVTAVGTAILAAVEAAAAGGQPDPTIVTKLDLREEAGLWIPPVVRLEEGVAASVRTYQTTLEQA